MVIICQLKLSNISDISYFKYHFTLLDVSDKSKCQCLFDWQSCIYTQLNKCRVYYADSGQVFMAIL